MGFHSGVFCTLQEMRSLVRRIEGAGGNTYVPRDRYSLMMSFCVVPVSEVRAMPCSSAVVTYSA